MATGMVFAQSRQGCVRGAPKGTGAAAGLQKVGVGFANYARMINDAEFRGRFLSIFT